MNKILLALAVTAAAVVSARAQSQSEALSFGARAFEAQAAGILPMAPADAFAGVSACGVLDIKSFRAWTLQEASRMASPCFKAVGEKYSAAIVLQAGELSAAAAGRPIVPGLLLKTELVRGSKGYGDLAASLERRGGRVLGQPVLLLARGETAPAEMSAVQDALHKCILTDVVRDISSGADFVKIYGSCLKRNADLKIDDLRGGAGLTVSMKTEQDDKSVEAMNGFVTVNAGKGPVQVMIVAYGATVAMP
jgi:hypothetical protein